MKKTALAAGILAIALPISSAWADVSETRDLDPFTEVEFDGLMNVKIIVGKEQSFEIIANKDKYLENVKTRVRGGRLRVDMDVDEGLFSFFQDVEVTINITVPELTYAEIDGLGDMDIENVDSETFELIIDGLGSATIDGSCGTARFVLDGMGDLNAGDLKCENVRLILDGMGDADIYASKSVDIDLDGFGDIEVYGDPEERKIREDGLGDIDFN